MLVLSRKTGEKLLIGNNITVTVTAIDGNRVKIGIEAPPEVQVRRVSPGEERRKAFAEANK